MQLLTTATLLPVTLAEAKLAARITDASLDALIPGWIGAARQLAEVIACRPFAAQTWRAALTDWPAESEVFPAYQATAVVISYWSGTAWVALSSGAFGWGAVDAGTSVAPTPGTSWPTLGSLPVGPRVRIDITAGPTTAAEVPDCVRTYILAMVAYWVDNGSAGADASLQEAPHLRALLDPVKVYG
jgi:uncharacterized phiE125 gp8 family phage protein